MCTLRIYKFFWLQNYQETMRTSCRKRLNELSVSIKKDVEEEIKVSSEITLSTPPKSWKTSRSCISYHSFENRCVRTFLTHLLLQKSGNKIKISFTEGISNAFRSTDLNWRIHIMSLWTVESAHVLIQARNKAPIDSSISKTGLEWCTE